MAIDAFSPAVDLVKALQTREVSARELLDLYLERVERHNPWLNAIVHLKRRAPPGDGPRGI
jgi:amidase